MGGAVARLRLRQWRALGADGNWRRTARDHVYELLQSHDPSGGGDIVGRRHSDFDPRRNRLCAGRPGQAASAAAVAGICLFDWHYRLCAGERSYRTFGRAARPCAHQAQARTRLRHFPASGIAALSGEHFGLLGPRLAFSFCEALDDGGAFLLAHDHPGADFLTAAAAAEADRARDIEGANIHAGAGDLFHAACLMRQAAGENCKKEDFRNLL